MLEMSSPDLNEVRVRPHKKIGRELGAHKRSHPDLKLLTKLEMSSPDLSEVRVQHSTWVEMFNANPKIVRVPLLDRTMTRLCGGFVYLLDRTMPRLCGEWRAFPLWSEDGKAERNPSYGLETPFHQIVFIYEKSPGCPAGR